VLQKRRQDGVMAIDDPEDLRSLSDDLIAATPVKPAECIVDERDARSHGLDRRREHGNPVVRDVNRRAEKPELIRLNPAFRQFSIQVRLRRRSSGWDV
jgi:hypothetical protein